ncbi:MAG: MFS transporter [Gammaproteobacteria bacterium]|nr:MFS transporter [Gammaproteobacteria bacterium]
MTGTTSNTDGRRDHPDGDERVFERGKQISVLTMSTLAFTVNFAVWTMFSIIGIRIKDELGLNETEFGLLVATPILTGSLVRLPLGILTDRYGGRIVYFIQMILVAIPTYGLAFADQYWQYLVIGLFVGLAGGSFAIGIAYTSAWFEKKYQGTAMGIFGAGNAGAAVTNLVAPMIVVALGWRAVPQIYSVAMLVMAVVFWFFTYPDPAQQERKRRKSHITLAAQLAPLTEARVWRFGLAYYFVFGGFVALALWLPRYYVGEYGLDLQTAALITIFFTLPSGLVRALGGWISDRYGGTTVTWAVFWVSLVCLFFLSYPATTMTIHGIEGDVSFEVAVGVVMFTMLVFVVGVAQGIGKASVYRLLADYYPGNMGSVGGLVGVIGGLGGFTLPIMFGIAADALNVRSSAFMLLYGVLAGVMVWTWLAERAERTNVLERRSDLQQELVKEHLISRVRRGRHCLEDWRPEDPEFWERRGKAIANRNLWLSMPALLIAFSVWLVWSVVVVQLPRVGFQFSPSQLFWLAALPGLSGAAFRVLYAFMVPIFGGRNWTVFSTLVLLLPALWMGFAVQDPGTDYAVFVAVALLCGLGAGNFASSMANISFFYPKWMQGTALGLNAGIGNLGVSLVQIVTPLVIYSGALMFFGGEPQTQVVDGQQRQVWLQNAGFIWVPFILLSAFASYLGMHDIRRVRGTFREQLVVFRRKHQWLMSVLYTGTFGSFIGLAASYPMLVSNQFPDQDAFKYAFLGPLLGALVRPVGGWLADRVGGARVTLVVFAVMALAALAVIGTLPGYGGSGDYEAFLTLFLVLFAAAGIGNGSTFKMVPVVFHKLHLRWSEGLADEVRARAVIAGDKEAAAVLGLSSAVAAFGGFFIPIAYATALDLTGGVTAALGFFTLFYLACLAVTWWWYGRRDAEVPC